MTQFVIGSTGVWVQRNSDGAGENIPAGIIPQVSEQFSISKVVGPGAAILSFQPRLASGSYSLTWGGVEFLYTLDHGQGMQGSEVFSLDNPVGLNRALLPTEQGSQTNGSSLVTCESISLFRGVNAAGDRAYMVTDAAEWFDPERITAPLPYNDRKASGFVRARDITYGDGSDTHLIKVAQTLTVPTRPDVQACRYEFISPASIYAPSTTFTRMYSLDVQNGTTTTEVFPVLDGAFLPNTATTPYIICSTDGATSAIGVYTPLPALRELGYYSGRYATGFMYVFYYDAHDNTTAVPAGNRVNNSYVCFGSLTQVAATMRSLYLKYG